MAKASRSKQPAFDPNELNDLIFSPAVGSGVGSHLLAKTDAFPSPVDPKSNPLPESLNVSTVATLHSLPVSSLRSTSLIGKNPDALITTQPSVSTVVTSKAEKLPEVSTKAPDLATVAMPVSHTVAMPAVSTVDISNWDVKLEPPRNRDEADQTTVATSDVSTVDTFNGHSRGYSAKVKLWITEQGDLIPEGRVKRIRLAQDVINSGEEAVYDTLWTAKGPAGEDRETSRVVQAGYDFLAKRTRLARKTIQRIVAKLIDKDFIVIERPADIYERTSTVYRVFSYRAVLDRHMQRGRTHVAKVGPGFSYVQPIDDPRSSQQLLDLSTVDTSHLPTVDTSGQATVVNKASHTVAEMNVSTVVRETTSYIGKDLLGKTTSVVHTALSAFGVVDDAALARLVRDCRDQAPDCTEQEIARFIHEKGRLVKTRGSKIQNPIGFLIDAVPKCFAGESFRTQRAAAAAVDQGREVTPVSRTDELQKTCWLLREMPKSVNAARWREMLAAAKDDETVSDDLRALISKVLAGAE